MDSPGPSTVPFFKHEIEIDGGKSETGRPTNRGEAGMAGIFARFPAVEKIMIPSAVLLARQN
jgi:hypothetical protein